MLAWEPEARATEAGSDIGAEILRSPSHPATKTPAQVHEVRREDAMGREETQSSAGLMQTRVERWEKNQTVCGEVSDHDGRPARRLGLSALK